MRKGRPGDQHHGHAGEPADLDPDVEGEEREWNVVRRQPDLGQGAGQPQPVQQAEGGGETPGIAPQLRTVAELPGHKTLARVHRYSRLSPDHLRDTVDRLSTAARMVQSKLEPLQDIENK